MTAMMFMMEVVEAMVMMAYGDDAGDVAASAG